MIGFKKLGFALNCLFFISACGGSDGSDQNVNTGLIYRANGGTVREQNQQLLSVEYANFRSTQVSNTSYQLSLQLDDESDIFEGQVDINFDMSETNISPLTIDFDSGEILSVQINGEEVPWQYERWYISIAPEHFSIGQNTLSIAYQRPYSTDGAGLHKFTDPENGEIYLYTNFEPYDANRLFPHFDQPNLKAAITLDVRAPSHWQIIGNTRESSIIFQDQSQHWFFPASKPISSYLYAMHAGPFTIWEDQAGDIPLRLFARNSLAPFVHIEDWFTPTQQSFAFFEEYFQVDYPFGKYDQVIVPDFNAGAMENVAAVTFSERYISRGEQSIAQRLRIASVISHEMAHMWFGDLVTMDWWNGLWLNESFASYMENLALDQASDFDNIWDSFYLGEKLWAYETDQLITTHPVELAVATTADAFTNFDGITYGKGSSILKQLPFMIGEENFRQGVSNYLIKHSYQNTTLDDFVSELALASNMNLDQWKQEWLYQSGVNTIEADFSCSNNQLTSLRLIQSVANEATANKVLRSQRTQVGLYRYEDDQMQLSSTFPVTYSGVVTHINEGLGQPCPDLVFPNEGDWAYMKINLDQVSLETLFDHINDFDNPTIRLMLWQSLSDSVDDGNMSLSNYIDFAFNNIGEEQDDNVLRLVSGNLGSAFNLYSQLGNYFDEKVAIETFLWNQLSQSEPGSERQKIWYASFINRAHTGRALSYLSRLLNGEESIAGIEIDQDKRWTIVVALNRYQYGPYQRYLEIEKARDGSDLGTNMGLAAEAIRPDTVIKEKWLNIIINDQESFKLATMRTVMSNLFPSEQHDLRSQYANQILSAVPEIAANSPQEYLGEFVGNISPALCTTRSVARLQQANEDFTELPPLVVKSYLIKHQLDQRCVMIGGLIR